MRRVSGYLSLVVVFGLVVAACGQVPEAVEAPSPPADPEARLSRR
ncbi:MAG: hypothetical protein OEM32_06570 [Acidimicrobiia bacterium]|nr:hypothetical protein [Acidimicrobiia bacterium]